MEIPCSLFVFSSLLLCENSVFRKESPSLKSLKLFQCGVAKASFWSTGGAFFAALNFKVLKGCREKKVNLITLALYQ